MKGINILMHILLVCISMAFASPSVASNEISKPETQKLLKDLDSNIRETLIKLFTLRDLVKKRGIENSIINWQKRKCSDVSSILKALEVDVKELQIMQLKESSITAAGKSLTKKKPSNHVDRFRMIEYSLREIACNLRKLAKAYKITDIPNYSVGLSHKEVVEAQNKKLSVNDANTRAYEKLTAMKTCIEVFRKEFIANRLLKDRFQSNMIGNFIPFGGDYDLSSNDVF